MAVITIHGAGGHGQAVAAAAKRQGWSVEFTDNSQGTEPDGPCHIAIGDNATRKKLNFREQRTIIHSTAFVDESVDIGEGTFVGLSASLHVGASVGRGVIVNTGAIVDHDCVVGDWVHLAPGAILCGRVTVGEGTFIGAGAIIRDGITIAPWTVIGCGAVVVKDITELGTYIGVPAHKAGETTGPGVPSVSPDSPSASV